MISLLRFSFALLLAFLTVPVTGWLTLVCADFIGLADCTAPEPGWMLFAAQTALALSLPPALYLWTDETHCGSAVLREGLRALLLSFALFAVLFLALVHPLARWLDLPPFMLASAMGRLAPLLACPLILLSHRIVYALMPRPEPESPAPRSMIWFSRLSLALIILVAAHPFLTDGVLIFSGKFNFLSVVWILLALRYLLADRGEAGFAPAWGALCLLCAIELFLSFPFGAVVEFAVAAALLALSLGSTFCLLCRASRFWLS